ncbi:hypothetical protein GCM10011369_13270 [Neiella marina]|uniref:Serine aminopeptidase S33 domain-containing protein n=1 Tax=Neiella marina TaxID=508461 RepID=A0A8J2U428_9GAMM|nr:alpha/beta fold hydrolase [Neiella marina]GGA72870.1 hypothetical protein GCM10011369_13270 [Neiella marina]
MLATIKRCSTIGLLVVWLSSLSASHADEQLLWINNGDYQIPVIINLPVSKDVAVNNKLPLVLMLHGTAGQKNEVGNLYQRLAAQLANVGIASARFDFAGTGDSPVDYQLYTLTSAVRDAQAVLRYCQQLAVIDGNHLGIIGFSQGGLIGQLLVNHPASPQGLDVLALWSTMSGNGTSSFSDFYQHYYPQAQQHDVASVKFEWRDAPLNFSRQWFEELAANTSMDQMKSYQGKLLLIAGDADQIVPYQRSVDLQRAATTAQTELHLIKGANHLFNVIDAGDELSPDQTKAEQLLKLTSTWFHQQLQAKDA